MRYHNCLEQLIKSISFPALVFDENHKVILKNTVVGQPYKWADSSPIGKTLFDLFPNNQASLLHDTMQNAIDLKQLGDHQIRLMAPEGHKELTVKIIPIFNPDSNSWFMICVIEDKLSTGVQTPADEIFEGSIKRNGKIIPCTETDVEEAKAALRFLLKEGVAQLTKLKEETFKNLATQILPYVDGLKNSRLNKKQMVFTDMIESNIIKLAEPFTRRISDPIFKLSPMEVKIASLIRGGKTNKEIAKMLNLSKSTILTHRHHVRAKLGLKNNKQNLRSFLNSLGVQLNSAEKKKSTAK
jgi:DNA-binding CsgD family transcriptional regulator